MVNLSFLSKKFLCYLFIFIFDLLAIILCVFALDSMLIPDITSKWLYPELGLFYLILEGSLMILLLLLYENFKYILIKAVLKINKKQNSEE